MEPDHTSFRACPIFFYSVNGSLDLVYQIRVEDVELVPLNDLWRRVVVIIVRLVILVPLVPRVNSVEVLRFSWPVLVMPPVYL